MNVEWRYVSSQAKAKHARRVKDDGRLRTAAICGMSPGWWADWLGTGDKAEKDRLTKLPPCKRCARRLAEANFAGK